MMMLLVLLLLLLLVVLLLPLLLMLIYEGTPRWQFEVPVAKNSAVRANLATQNKNTA